MNLIKEHTPRPLDVIFNVERMLEEDRHNVWWTLIQGDDRKVYIVGMSQHKHLKGINNCKTVSVDDLALLRADMSVKTLIAEAGLNHEEIFVPRNINEHIQLIAQGKGKVIHGF